VKFQEIATRVKSGEITLDSCGHLISKKIKEDFIKNFEDLVESANGSNDEKWIVREGETMEERNLEMREFYQRMLDREIKENKSLVSSEKENCFGCGEKLQWIFNANKLTLREFYNKEIQNPNRKSKGDFDAHSLDYRCPYEHPKPFVGEIKVSSRLIFANFFRQIEDSPEDKRYTEFWSLNNLVGRENITKHKCKKNVAYGQMSNMSIGIYVNENKDSIIVGPDCNPAEYKKYDSDEEYEAACDKSVFEGYQLVDTICLDVWRWEATDLDTIGEKNYNTLVEDQRSSGLVEINAKHGIWKFEHFFDSLDEYSENYCYAKLTLC